MKRILSILLFGLALPDLSRASVTITADAENVSVAPILVTSSSPSGFSDGTVGPDRAVFVDEGNDDYGLEIVRFTMRGDSTNVIDELVVTGSTTSVPSSAYATTLVFGYDDQIGGESLSLVSAPEPARTSLLAVALGAFALRRRRR